MRTLELNLWNKKTKLSISDKKLKIIKLCSLSIVIIMCSIVCFFLTTRFLYALKIVQDAMVADILKNGTEKIDFNYGFDYGLLELFLTTEYLFYIFAPFGVGVYSALTLAINVKEMLSKNIKVKIY